MGKRSELSDCEMMTMKCVWALGEPSTCPEIMEKIKEEFGITYKDTTVYTFLKNLIGKGFVQTKRRGVNFYSAARDFEEFRDFQLEDSIKFWYEGSPAKMIENLVQLDCISASDIEEMKKVLDSAKK